jgi:drug efflux transport system permease protein
MARDAADAGERMTPRFWSLALKELRQIRRDRRLMISLTIPPVIQLLVFGLALDPEVKDLRVGIVDESRTAESRELVSAITENRTLRLAGAYPTTAALGRAIADGRLDLGVVVPHEFARQLGSGQTADVQILINGVNANTAQLAQGHVEGAVAWLNQKPGVVAPVELRTAFLYNPGLVHTWFTITGVLGALIVLNGSLVAAAAMIKEKELGTVEQLLMTPASAFEVVAAKIAPLFVLLMGMTGLALSVARLVFHVPFRGSLVLLITACAFCVLTGIGIGTFVATMARSATQAQLMLFFVNPPLMALSGGFTPIEAMPKWIQPFTYLNPIAHFATLARGVLVRGSGVDVVYVHLLALGFIATMLVGFSAWKFRGEMS